MTETLIRNFESRIEELTAIFGRPPRADEVLPDFGAADSRVLHALSAAYENLIEREEQHVRELERKLERKLERYRIQPRKVARRNFDEV